MSRSQASPAAPDLHVGADESRHPTWAARRRSFRILHERGCFVIPNPWDVGSARYLQHLGFPALATTSAGFAFSRGLPDSGDAAAVSRDRNLVYVADIAGAVDLPVSADFMSGYGATPPDVAESVRRCVATGAAGLSIEDGTGDPSRPLYDLPVAVERLRAARQAIDRSGEDVLLTARAECFHVGHPDPLRESVRRLRAYAAAGADVLFAPGPQTPAEIEALVAAAAPRPLNLLVVRDLGLKVDEIAALGVRRISVGGALALAAWTGFVRAARTLKSEGSFAGLAQLVPYAEINGLFSSDVRGAGESGRSRPGDSDCPLIAAAVEYAKRLSEPYLFNHAMRSWLFAELIGRLQGIDFDPEVVAVGTILHDIGLTPAVSGARRFEVNGADAARSFVRAHGLSDRRAQLVWDLVALNSTPSLALHKEPEVAVGTMGIGLDYGGFGLDALPPDDVDRILGEFPRLRMKDRFSEACARLVKERPQTAHDNFLRDFGERFVPGYRAVSTVDVLVNAPFEE